MSGDLQSEKTDDPARVDVMKDYVRSEKASMRTVLPAKVLSYDKKNQKAKVQPVIVMSHHNEDGERETREPNPIQGVPVLFPQSKNAGFSITWPLKPGDWVKLSFASHSLDKWLASGADSVTPEDERRFDFSDAICEPGIRPFADSLPSEAVDSDAGVIRTPELHIGKSEPNDWIALAKKTKSTINSLITTLNNFITGIYNTHTHQQVMPLIPISPGPTGPPQPTGSGATKTTDSDYKSDKVKSE